MYKCCICDNQFDDFGNNPSPLMKSGKCCDKCNFEKVLALRIYLAGLMKRGLYDAHQEKLARRAILDGVFNIHNLLKKTP